MKQLMLVEIFCILVSHTVVFGQSVDVADIDDNVHDDIDFMAHDNKDYQTQRVINGVKADLPFFVSINATRDVNSTFCGGSLIQYNAVLTAAQCVNGFEPNDIIVLYGASTFYDRKTVKPKSVVIHQRFEWIKGPGYDLVYNDIAIIFLKKTLKGENVGLIGWHIAPKGTIAYMAGFGSQTQRLVETPPIPYTVSKKLLVAKVVLLGNQKCWRTTGNQVRNNQLCAWGKNQNACEGDGGGPLYGYKEGKYVQFGILSLVYGCADDRFPSVYTRVPKMLPWISNKIKTQRFYTGTIRA